MKISVRVRGEWLQVPCKKGDETVQWMSEEALKRYFKLSAGSYVRRKSDTIDSVRKTRGGAILDPTDMVKDVLDDNDFISVVLESDRPNPVTDQPQIKYIPEQIAANELPTDQYITLDGNTLTPEDLVSLGRGTFRIRLSRDAEEKISIARKLVDKIVDENKVAYGITTGLGKFARTVIPKEKLPQVQLNIIRSHSAGVGNPLTPDKTRMLLALRVNVLAKGYSGISMKTVLQYIDAFNASCLPWVPEKGTVGASGDLAPLAHLALGLLGEGKMWSPKTGWGNAHNVLDAYGLKPLSLGAKEGLALINGTQLISSFGSEAVVRADEIAKQGDVVAALSLEVLKGTSRAFDSSVMKLRNHRGQQEVARRLTALLHSETYPSEIAESHRFCNRVQDAYTLRCCPQVHGIVHDTLHFVRGIITDELNSATDNPLILAERGEIISAGNFHGEYPAKVLDYLAIAIHELASMSERRIERLVNPAYSELPAFLVKEGGFNSGFMLAHCTAASLVSENKVLCHPASVDSLTTSGGTEDHVSMGGFAARKALMVVENVERVIAIELLAACQAIEFLRPMKTTVPLEEVIKVVRSVTKPIDTDHFMAPDIDAVTELLKEGKIWHAVKFHIDNYHSEQDFETRVFSPTMFVTEGEPLPRPQAKGKRTSAEVNNSSSAAATPKRPRKGSKTFNA